MDLVTGANGFLGAAVVRALLADGRAVRAFVRRGSDRRNLEGLAVDVAEGDLNDRDSLRARRRAVALRCSTSRPTIGYGRSDAAPMYRTNVEGSVNVLEAAADAAVERLVYTSSVAVLGINRDPDAGRREHAGGARGHDRRLQTVEVSGRAGGAAARRASSACRW